MSRATFCDLSVARDYSFMEILSQNNDEFFMRAAFKQAEIAFAKDEVPVGAIIVFDNKIIAKAHNQVEILKDPTAHAEMIAITQAASSLGNKWLHECVLYVTLEPCSMCAGALVLSRIKRVCFGTTDPKTGAGGSILNILQHDKLNHQIEMTKNILTNECGALLSEFFKKKRVVNN